jgi:hypothetical protein
MRDMKLNTFASYDSTDMCSGHDVNVEDRL